MNLHEIKKALEDGKPVFENAQFKALNATTIEWTLTGCRWHFGDNTIGSWDKPFIDEAMTPEYLANHLFTRQQLFGSVKI